MRHISNALQTRLCIIRHGETDWNADGRIQGHTDISLNEAGQAQARVLAMACNAAHQCFHAIYSSDLARARETAQVLAQRAGHEVRQLPQLRERHYGIFQGLTAPEGAEHYPAAYAHYLARDPDYDFETGESLCAFAQRVAAGIDWLARHHLGQTLAVVCHSGVLDVVYRRATGRGLTTPRDFAIPNCALNWFHCDAQGWHVDVWGDRHHLGSVLTQPPE
ncbi:histidine phosphatase family protein [uncultured Thiodictyon sp.]|uniref:histidine phosphatase family protein n=1 Tax=uncultured Thiodictyon sp. TaxID=1846217 RepID=UPI00260125E4|nr:histidine phosphatase family protein [uncultured Thiodictyon sp.]